MSYWCLVMVERLILAVPRGCLQFVIVVISDHTHLLFFSVFFTVFLKIETLLLKLKYQKLQTMQL